MKKTRPCRLCGNPIPARYVYHPQCLANVRSSYPYRDVALRRDGYVCARCPQPYNRAVLWAHAKARLTRRVDVDHIIPLGAGGPNTATNLQVLCKRHHRQKTRVDIARMKGNKPPAPWRQHPIAAALLLIVAYWFGARLFHATTDAVAHASPRTIGTLAVIAALTATGAWVGLKVRTRMRRRVWRTIITVTDDSDTKINRALKTGKWRWQRIPGHRVPRLRPTRIALRYPNTFPDHDPKKRAELEDRVVAKMGGSWSAKWTTPTDRVAFQSPDPLVELGGIPWPLLGATSLSMWDPIPIGVDEAGDTVTVNMTERNMLIGGEPGSGKSVAQSMLTAAAALDPACDLWGIDGKGYVEQGVWHPVMEDLVGSGPTGHADATALIDNLRTIMDGRYQMLYDAARSDGTPKRKMERSDISRGGQHLHVLIIDELAVFTSGGTRTDQQKFTEALRDLISRGRAAGIIVVAATQRPSADVVPTQIRDLIGYRWAMRCTTPTASDMVLGQGQSSAGYSASRVSAATRGIGYLLAEGDVPTRLRSYLVDDAALHQLAQRAERVRRGRVFASSGGEL